MRMTRTRVCVVVLGVLAGALWLLPARTWSAGACATYKTFATGDSVTHTDLNSLQTTLGQSNAIFSCLDDYSGNAAQMKTTVDPWQNYAESLATTGQGEIERLRYMWKGLCNFTHWYSYTDNCSFVESGRSLHFHMGTITTSHLAIGIAATWNNATANFRTFDIDIYPVLRNDASHAMRVTFNGLPTFAVSHAMVWAHGLTITSGHTSTSHSYQQVLSPERVARQIGDTITLANGADAVLGDSLMGMLFVSEEGQKEGSCLFTFGGQAGIVTVHINAGILACSNDQGKANTLNAYWNVVKSQYEIRNNRGDARTLRLLFIGGDAG